MGASLTEQMQQGRACAAAAELTRRCDREQSAVLTWKEARDAFALEYWSAFLEKARSLKGAAALAGVSYERARRICCKLGIRSPTARGRFAGEAKLTPQQRRERSRLSQRRSKQRQRAADQHHSIQTRSQS